MSAQSLGSPLLSSTEATNSLLWASKPLSLSPYSSFSIFITENQERLLLVPTPHPAPSPPVIFNRDSLHTALCIGNTSHFPFIQVHGSFHSQFMLSPPLPCKAVSLSGFPSCANKLNHLSHHIAGAPTPQPSEIVQTWGGGYMQTLDRDK